MYMERTRLEHSTTRPAVRAKIKLLPIYRITLEQGLERNMSWSQTCSSTLPNSLYIEKPFLFSEAKRLSTNLEFAPLD